MIEVEKKFQPTEEQLAALLQDAEFVGDKVLEDKYYDYPDYRLFHKKIFFRNRNGEFELKLGDDEGLGVSEELETEEEIKKYFKTDKPLKEFIQTNLVQIIEYVTKRKKYKKGEFNIDIDDLSFGFSCIEIEVMIDDMSKVEEAKSKIYKLVEEFGIEKKNLPAKREEYFRIMKPEVYKLLYS